jgi:site-specific DNA-methyltransferase (adenine-specific)
MQQQKLPLIQPNTIYHGDALAVLKDFPAAFVDCIVTSPPYWKQRNYNVIWQLGLEYNFSEYLDKLLRIFDEVKRVLKPSGTCFVNLGDTSFKNNITSPSQTSENSLRQHKKQIKFDKKFTGGKRKSFCMLPERFAIGMIDRGWILRNQIIWHKPNQLPSSVKDRFTVDFEKVFFFTKSPKYYFEQQFEPYKKKSLQQKKDRLVGHKAWDNDNIFGGRGAGEKAIMKFNPAGRNKRCVWSVNTKPSNSGHFATYPEELINPMIKAGCPPDGIVLDPFFGSGTTGVVAQKLGRNYIGIELSAKYIDMAKKELEVKCRE